MKDIAYKNLDKHFTLRKRSISPFYGNIRIPRKLKKKVKKFCGVHYKNLKNGQILWFYLDHVNLNYKRFLIKHIIEN